MSGIDDSRNSTGPAGPAVTGLILLSTEHCTLCERALDLLTSMPELRGRTLRVVDVAGDADLLERYGPRLPVLRYAGRELVWPFRREDVAAFLS